jgi:hemoglobin
MKGRAFSTLITAAAIVWVTVLPGVAQDESTTAPPTRSLYARLGGYDFVARFVDTAFPRVASHPQLRRMFQGHSKDSQMRQRQLIVDALCQAAGGPCAYTGRAMKSVHSGLGITETDWTVFMSILTGALEDLKVGPPERKEFLDLLEQRFKAGVVEKG